MVVGTLVVVVAVAAVFVVVVVVVLLGMGGGDGCVTETSGVMRTSEHARNSS